MPIFVKISQTVAEIWQFLDFLKMAAVCHPGFSGNFNSQLCAEAADAWLIHIDLLSIYYKPTLQQIQ